MLKKRRRRGSIVFGLPWCVSRRIEERPLCDFLPDRHEEEDEEEAEEERASETHRFDSSSWEASWSVRKEWDRRSRAEGLFAGSFWRLWRLDDQKRRAMRDQTKEEEETDQREMKERKSSEKEASSAGTLGLGEVWIISSSSKKVMLRLPRSW